MRRIPWWLLLLPMRTQRNTRWVPQPARRMPTFIMGLILGLCIGWATSPGFAHAAESYGSQLERIARAVENISRVLERAAR